MQRQLNFKIKEQLSQKLKERMFVKKNTRYLGILVSSQTTPGTLYPPDFNTLSLYTRERFNPFKTRQAPPQGYKDE